jgi:hypothetical protein
MIDFIENAVIGEIYDVPCVGYRHTGFHKSDIFVPVIPFYHADRQFGTISARWAHFHIDARFTTPIQDNYFDILPNGGIYRIISSRTKRFTLKIVLKKKTCVRTFTGMKAEILPEGHSAHDWYKKQIGKSCAGNICPHYKIKMQRVGNGLLECPMHGLIGDEKTMKIVGNVHGV